ncbi:MAG: MmcQ/YjbR family DNA-binding protein [Hyphomonadaceae bacterium]|nr:MmcQ/YjbR family DNA-binding protein [Hyphomonadaceae bacterium]
MTGWEDLKAFALALNLPHVEEAISWGSPNLKAHGKMWCWWAPQDYANAPAFKVDAAEMEFLLDVRSDIFFTSDHHRPHNIVLMRPERFDPDWAKANLMAVWRKQAPKRWLKQWDVENPGHVAAKPGP